MRNAHFRDRWHKILEKMPLNLPASLKIAILEADALVNDFLVSAGAGGAHLSDRIDRLSPDFKTLDRLRNAHRFKNYLENTTHLEISEADVKETLEDYESFLEEAGVL